METVACAKAACGMLSRDVSVCCAGMHDASQDSMRQCNRAAGGAVDRRDTLLPYCCSNRVVHA